MRRIQRRREKGWRMPEGAIYVGRPSLFGNPWTPRDAIAWDIPPAGRAAWCVKMYRDELKHLGLLSDYAEEAPRKAAAIASLNLPTMRAYARRLLRGHDLVCWCPLDQPCHADVLLDLVVQRATERVTQTPAE